MMLRGAVSGSPAASRGLARCPRSSVPVPLLFPARACRLATPPPWAPRVGRTQRDRCGGLGPLRAPWRCDRTVPPSHRYDAGKDGFIDLMELKLMMEKLGAPQTHLGLKNMIKEVDEDLDSKLSFREVGGRGGRHSGREGGWAGLGWW